MRLEGYRPLVTRQRLIRTLQRQKRTLLIAMRGGIVWIYRQSNIDLAHCLCGIATLSVNDP